MAANRPLNYLLFMTTRRSGFSPLSLLSLLELLHRGLSSLSFGSLFHPFPFRPQNQQLSTKKTYNVGEVKVNIQV